MGNGEFDYIEAGRALRRFFQSKGMPEPEDAAQEAIARLIEKSLETAISDPSAYVKGIARNMVRDHFKKAEPEIVFPTAAPERVDERLLRCLELCERKHLTGPERKLLRDWYRSDGAAKIRDRRRLAENLGITPDALKTRVFRLRHKLAPHVRECCESLEEG